MSYAENKYKQVWLVGLLYSATAMADSLIVSSSTLVETLLPAKYEQIKTALQNSGVDTKFQDFPSQRGLVMQGRGEITIDSYRNR